MAKARMPDPIILKRVMPGGYWYGDVFGYTRLQMEAYANERVREALEEAALAVADHAYIEAHLNNFYWDSYPNYLRAYQTILDAQKAIRALIPKQEPKT